jgi:hypothetical protein
VRAHRPGQALGLIGQGFQHLGALVFAPAAHGDDDVEDINKGQSAPEFGGQFDGELVKLVVGGTVHADVDVRAAWTHASTIQTWRTWRTLKI